MTGQAGDDRTACAALTYLAEPADPVLGELLQVLPPAGVLAWIRSGRVPGAASDVLEQAGAAGLRPALPRWRARLAGMDLAGLLARHQDRGIRLACPGDPG